MARSFLRAARKSAPSYRYKDRKGIYCSFVSAPDSDSDSASEAGSDNQAVNDLDGFEPVSSEQQQEEATRCGFTVQHGVHTGALKAKTFEKLAALAYACSPKELLPEEIRNAWDKPSENYRVMVHSEQGAFTLISCKAFKKGAVVAVAGGSLRTKQQWDKKLGHDISHEAHVWSYDISCAQVNTKTLPRGRTYVGPDFVLDQQERSNFTRYFQDASWLGDRPNSVVPELLLVRQRIPHPRTRVETEIAVPHIIFTATRDIEEGQEMFLDWGADCWLALSKIQVMGQAHSNWALWLLQRKLQEKRGQLAGPSGSGAGSSASAAGAQEEQGGQRKKQCRVDCYMTGLKAYMELPGEEADAHVLPLRPSTVWQDQGAGAAANSHPSQVFKPLTEQQVRQAFPGYITQSIEKLSEEAKEVLESLEAKRPLTEQEKALLQSGELPKCEVVEIVGMSHPARWCSLPQWRSYGVVAKEVIKQGEPIGAYVGTLRTEKDFNAEFEGRGSQAAEQAYAFNITSKDLRKACKNMPEGRRLALVMESKVLGNATRFVNCKWGAEKEQEKRLANACAEVVFDEAASMPAVFLYATRRIDPGEEVMADYGDEYWRIMSRYLQMQHHKCYRDQRKACEELALALVRGGILTKQEVAAMYDEAHKEADVLPTYNA